MHDLQLVGVHPDGDHLLLLGGDGQRYRVPIDDALRAAVRRDRARLGQLQIAMEGTLRPKEIQARIRAGQSAADVAAASGLPLEHVRRYEGAVLAEREHVARRARSVPVRRRQGPPPSLDDAAAERLSARDAAATREWDAWRGEDGSWTVLLAFRTGTRDRTAHWRFDLLTSALEPLDDEARWLTADTDGEDGPVAGRRLTAVRERVYDVEADGGVREQPGSSDGRPSEGRQARGAGAAPGAASGGSADQPAERERRRTVDILETLRGRRGRRQPLADPDQPDDDLELPAGAGLGAGSAADDDVLLIDEILGHAGSEAADGTAEPVGAGGAGGLLDEAGLAAAMRASELQDEAPYAHPPASRPDEATDAHILALPGPSPEATPRDAGSDTPPVADEAPPDDSHSDEARSDEARSDEARSDDRAADTGSRARSRSKRTTVPSWDDIVFGARRD